MNDDLHNIDDLFKRALEEHTELPSPAVWDNIDKSLDKKKVISVLKKYNNLKRVAAVLLLFSIGMAMYTLHTRIKNKELVKQHSARKNLKNQKTPTNNDWEDSVNPVNKNNTGFEKATIGTRFRKQNDDTPTTGNNKIANSSYKNTTGNLNKVNEQAHDYTRVKSPPEEKAGNQITNQKQKQLSLKNTSEITIQEKSTSAEIDSANRNKNSLIPIVRNNDEDMAGKEQRKKPDPDIVVSKEKYVGPIPLIPLLNTGFQLLATKPVLQVPEIPTPSNVVLSYAQPVSLKNNKAVYLKQRGMKNNSPHLLSATIFISPDLVSTDVENDHPLFREEDRHEIKKNEKIKSSYTVGVLIDYSMGRNWKLESGVTFSARFTDIQPKTIYARPDNYGNVNYRFNCSAGYSFVTLKSPVPPPVSGDSIRALSSKNVLQYAGVALVIKYAFGNGKFDIIPGAGVSANFLTRGQIKTAVPTTSGNESVSSNSILGLKSMYFNGLVSIAAEYKLNKTLGLTFMPTARFALSPINKDVPVKTYLNSIGFVTGVIIKL